MQMEGKIFGVHIPMEDVMEIKSGKKQVVKRKQFPGYLLVRMVYDNDSWYVVRNTPGVTGFVSAGTGSKPTPLSKHEVDKILAVKKEEVRPQVRSGSRRATSSGSRRGRSPTSTVRSTRSTRIRPSSRCWSTSSTGRRRSSCPSTRCQRSSAIGKERTLRRGRPEGRLDRRRCRHGSEEEGARDREAPDHRRTGDPGAPRRDRAGSARREHHGVLQAVQRRDQQFAGQIIPVELTIYEDRSFTFVLKQPPAAELIRKAAGIEKGSGEPNREKVARLSKQQVREIAERKMVDLNANDMDNAMRIIEGRRGAWAWRWRRELEAGQALPPGRRGIRPGARSTCRRMPSRS